MTIMDPHSYPALFRCADEASNKKQKIYLRLIGWEYVFLFSAAVFSLNEFSGRLYYLAYAFVFVICVVLLLSRALLKPEQHWYKCRALAESVKTMTWRYVMRAAPFNDATHVSLPRAEFRDHLYEVFSQNQSTAEMILPDWSADEQITGEMERVRALNLSDRKKIYAEERIRDQRSWYAKKATANRNYAAKWVTIGVIAYLLAGVLVLARIEVSDWKIWPIEPIIVFASSVIGWMQVKKYNELGAAYTVAAHEIGMLSSRLEDVKSETEFSDFVNEAELAFSREHTLWVARLSS